MRIALLSLSLLALSTAVGCSSSSNDSATTNDSNYTGASSTFQSLLACDGAAASLEQDSKVIPVVDFDHGGGQEVNEHDLRFVVKDQGVVDYLSSKVNHIQNMQHEVVLRGSIHEGASFDFFEDWTFAAPSTRADGNKVRISDQVVGVVHRVKNDPDASKVRIVFNQTTIRNTCSTYWDEDHCAFDVANNTRGTMTSERTDTPIIDWVFHCVAP